MARKSTIKLLLINESDNETERLISVFRNAGRVARSTRPKSVEELHDLLQTGEWDLVIANTKHPDIPLDQCLNQIKKDASPVPVIVICDDEVITTLEAGASDVVSTGDDQRLVLAAFRELERHNNYRELLATREKLEDAEQRSQLLMSESQQAIAYLADGMLISCNQNFAERFGHDSADDLDCSPVIDLISSDDHEHFKTLLKAQLTAQEGAAEDSSTRIDVQAVTSGGEPFAASMQLSNAVFDEEACIQITIAEAGGANGGAVNSDTDATTGFYNFDYGQLLLDRQLSAKNFKSSLLFIAIDEFDSIRNRLGIVPAKRLAHKVGDFFSDQIKESGQLAHCGDDSYTLLINNISSDDALKLARKLRKGLEKHIIDLDGQSAQCTASIGVASFDHQSGASAEALTDAAFHACQQARKQGDGPTQHIAPRAKKKLVDGGSDKDIDSFLQEALEDQRFSLSYQPVVSLRGASGEHYEVRSLMNDEGEMLRAGEFLQRMNFAKANTRLDRWILLEATKQLSEKIRQKQDARLFINLTANALQDDSLVGWFGVALKASGIPPKSVIFQFVESEVEQHLKAAAVFCKHIKKLGCKFSITQFGKSDNATKALLQLKPDFAKIAKQYAESLQNGGDTEALQTMVSSITENKTQIIISGVDKAQAMAQLWQLGVDFMQGSYLSEPIDSMDYEFTDMG